MSATDLDAFLQRAACRACGEHVTYQGFFPITASVDGAVVWTGIVSLFIRVSGKGGVYAWPVEGNAGRCCVAFVKEPPIETPLDGVRAWLEGAAPKQ